MSLHRYQKSPSKYPTVVLLAVIVVCSGLGISQVPAWAARTSESESDTLAFKPYMPFDEPKPKIPKEILSDARLDQKVKVFVKSKNFKELFHELSEKTGVKITANRELWAERAIIYFHDKPLRDVLTEISRLFGYHWLVEVENGEKTYQLFEDIRHANRRNQLRYETATKLDALILDSLRATSDAMANQTVYEQLEQAHPGLYRLLQKSTYVVPTGERAILFSLLGEYYLRQLMADYERKVIPLHSLPLDLLDRIVYFANKRLASHLREPLAAHELTSYSLVFQRGKFRDREVGRLTLWVEPTGEIVPYMSRRDYLFVTWPPGNYWWGVSESEMSALMGANTSDETKRELGEGPLPDAPKIRADKLRTLFTKLGPREKLVLGDALQAIAEQAKLSIIADYYFQEVYPNPATGEYLAKFVRAICEKCNYTYQSEGSTLRLRYNEWFYQPLDEEPPPDLLSACWRKIEETGALGLDEAAKLGSLSQRQIGWRGFRYMFGAVHARLYGVNYSLWKAIKGSSLAAEASSQDGVRLSKLSKDELEPFYTWLELYKSVGSIRHIPQTDLAQASIIMEEPESPKKAPDITLWLHTGQCYGHRVMLMPPMKENYHKVFIKQRRADQEADKIEVLH